MKANPDPIPATEARLAGNKVSDLIEALSRLDPDAKVDTEKVRTFCGRLHVEIEDGAFART